MYIRNMDKVFVIEVALVWVLCMGGILSTLTIISVEFIAYKTWTWSMRKTIFSFCSITTAASSCLSIGRVTLLNGTWNNSLDRHPTRFHILTLKWKYSFAYTRFLHSLRSAMSGLRCSPCFGANLAVLACAAAEVNAVLSLFKIEYVLWSIKVG